MWREEKNDLVTKSEPPMSECRGRKLSLTRARHLRGSAMPGGNDTQGCSGEGGSLVDSPTLH